MDHADRPRVGVVTPTHFLSISNLRPIELEACLRLAAQMKAARAAGTRHVRPLEHRHVALLFEKPSLRTRATFQVAVHELGGHVIELPSEVALGGREPIADVARNLERWVFAAIVRTFAHARLEQFAAAAPRLRLVNALTDAEHPCQALADCLTMQERWGTLRGRTIAFVGDGNNVARSLAQAVTMLGATLRIASPEGYELDDEHRASIAMQADPAGGRLELMRDPVAAVDGVDAVYTDVWTSMGQEAEDAERRVIFAPYQVNSNLMAAAGDGALFMHCLPAHRGDEVTDAVIDSEASVVYDQSENRLHTQKALLALLAQ